MTMLKKVLVFAGDEFMSLCDVGILIPRMREMGLEPIIINTGGISSQKAAIPELEDVRFYETDLLNDTVVPFLDENPLTETGDLIQARIAYSFNELINIYGIDYHDIDDCNNVDFVNSIANDADIIGGFSVCTHQIFQENLIETMREKGFFWNLHRGLLPAYKGVLVLYRAIENKEKEFGWTLYDIDNGIDTGAIISTTSVELDSSKPIIETYFDVLPNGVQMVLNGLKYYLDNGCAPKSQPQKEECCYYSFPTGEEMNRWNSMGIQFANAAVIPDMYARYLSVEGTQHRGDLKRCIEAAITTHDEGLFLNTN